MCNLCSSKINCGTCDKKDNPDIETKGNIFPKSPEELAEVVEIEPEISSRHRKAIPPTIIKGILTVDGKRFHIKSQKRQKNDPLRIQICTLEDQIFHLKENKIERKGKEITYLSLIKQEKDPVVKKSQQKPILPPILLPEELELS